MKKIKYAQNCTIVYKLINLGLLWRYFCNIVQKKVQKSDEKIHLTQEMTICRGMQAVQESSDRSIFHSSDRMGYQSHHNPHQSQQHDPGTQRAGGESGEGG